MRISATMTSAYLNTIHDQYLQTHRPTDQADHRQHAYQQRHAVEHAMTDLARRDTTTATQIGNPAAGNETVKPTWHSHNKHLSGQTQEGISPTTINITFQQNFSCRYPLSLIFDRSPWPILRRCPDSFVISSASFSASMILHDGRLPRVVL